MPVHLAAHYTTNYSRRMDMIKTMRGMECQGRRGVPVYLAAHTNITNHPERKNIFIFKSAGGRECQGRRGVPVHLAAHTIPNIPRMMMKKLME